MTVVLQIGNRSITADEVLPLVAGYQMLPQFLQEILIDQAISTIDCTPEEAQEAQQQFYIQNQITTAEDRQGWLRRFGMTQTQLEALATRELRVEKYKQQTWGPKLESYFLNRKDKLDKVIYSLIRTKDAGIAQELYFRILEGEESFAELARTYSEGPEAQTDGLIGPVELSVPHPTLAQILSLSQPGQINPPTRIGSNSKDGGWIVLVRLEKFIPAQMDESMRRRLLNECFNTWLQEQLTQLDVSALSLAVSPESAAAIASEPAIESHTQNQAESHAQNYVESHAQGHAQTSTSPADSLPQPAEQPTDPAITPTAP